MKDFYIWYCIVVVMIATGANYWVSSSARSWNTGGGSYQSSTGWHK